MSQATEPSSVKGWHDFDVTLPGVNWNTIVTSDMQQVNSTADSCDKHITKYQLAPGIDICLVEKVVT